MMTKKSGLLTIAVAQLVDKVQQGHVGVLWKKAAAAATNWDAGRHRLVQRLLEPPGPVLDVVEGGGPSSSTRYLKKSIKFRKKVFLNFFLIFIFFAIFLVIEFCNGPQKMSQKRIKKQIIIKKSHK
jgi:hypothetical protein